MVTNRNAGLEAQVRRKLRQRMVNALLARAAEVLGPPPSEQHDDTPSHPHLRLVPKSTSPNQTEGTGDAADGTSADGMSSSGEATAQETEPNTVQDTLVPHSDTFDVPDEETEAIQDDVQEPDLEEEAAPMKLHRVHLPHAMPPEEPEPIPEPSTATDRDAPVLPTALYVYAILPDVAEVPLPLAGIDPAFPVEVLPFRNVQVVLSRVPLASFSEEALRTHLEDRSWLEMAVQRHYAILERMRSRHGVLPMRFCTICYHTDGLRQFLEDHYFYFAIRLRALANKQEWGIRLYAHTPTLAHRAALENTRLRRMRQRMDAAPGTAYLVRKQVERVEQEAVRALRRSERDEVHHTLAGLAFDAIANSVEEQRDVEAGEVLVLNAAYLVDIAQQEAFLKQVEGMQQTAATQGLRVHLTGPWLPFNFVRDDLTATSEPALARAA